MSLIASTPSLAAPHKELMELAQVGGSEARRLAKGHQSLRNRLHPSTSFRWGAKNGKHRRLQSWGGLVMERASFSLGRQAPARRRTLIPSTLLRGTPRAEALHSFYVLV
jgi:hypothetical protein